MVPVPTPIIITPIIISIFDIISDSFTGSQLYPPTPKNMPELSAKV